MDTFYQSTINSLLRANVLNTKMRILVVCGGDIDKEVLLHSGFSDVIISNLDTRISGDEFSPFMWSFQDAENLTYEIDAFDFTIVHNGLHHCHSPHRVFLEMYRVSRKGLLLFEPYDNLFTRLGVLLSFGQDYEHSAVFAHDCSFGGVRNTKIPNYVYRWTTREIVKTICAFAPFGHHDFTFIHKLRIPWQQLKKRRNKLYVCAVLLALSFLKIFTKIFPKQSNCYAACVLKPEFPRDLHPWLHWDNGQIKPNHAWMANRYKKRDTDSVR